MPRERTKSSREEFSVSSYVDSCVSFRSNVTCHAFADCGSDAATKVSDLTLILLPENKSGDVNFVKPPFWTPALDAARARAGEGSVYPVDLPTGRRVCIGILPTDKVSRTNCPSRPDVISKLVATCVSAKGFDSLNVVSCLGGAHHALPTAAAVAKGSKRSFSAKSGLADKAWYEPCIPIRLYLEAADHAVLNTVTTGVQLCMRLVDAPTNLLDTTTFPEIAERYAQELKFGCVITRGEDLREKGYGGIYGVGKAAEFPPALVHLTYTPGGGIKPKDKIALVGKGIVYDTGGLAIKHPGTNMCGMKMDMGGAAALFSAFLALVRLKAPYTIDCVLCIADNAIGPRSQRNDDIVVMKSGRSVEINNTDAEGRLVLGDGVFHAATETGAAPPSVILDMATLTGAQGIATGTRHAGLYCNSAAWEQRVVAAGIESGDLVFPLLFCPEFHMPEFSSKVADMRNSVRNRGNAQSSCAAAFIGDNLPRDYTGAHVHIDMAAPAHAEEGATGYGVALVVGLFAN
jgi:probable aminopeptidase NPEPL1